MAADERVGDGWPHRSQFVAHVTVAVLVTLWEDEDGTLTRTVDLTFGDDAELLPGAG